MRIDLQNDPEIPAGRDLIEHLVGAHLVAADEEELLHMVGVSISELSHADREHSLRVLMHAAYQAQSMIVSLLDLAAEQSLALEDAPTADKRQRRLELWRKVTDLRPRGDFDTDL